MAIQFHCGRYSDSYRASMSQRAKMISTTIRKVKPLPVMKGKRSDLVTIKGINGVQNRPVIIVHLRVLFSVGFI